MFPVLFTPAGYVFSIWGLIYLLLIGFALYQLLYNLKRNSLVPSIGILFIVSCLLNISWIFSWHYIQIPLSMLIMLGLLASLIAIYLRINSTKQPAISAERWLVKLPFSIYLGWVSVATIANLNALLYYLGWYGTGLSASFLTVAMIAFGIIPALFMLVKQKDLAYALVFVWAFVGIGVRHGNEVILVTAAAWAASALILILAVNLYRKSLMRYI